MNVSKMNKEQIDNEFRREAQTFDFNTLLNLFCQQFDTKTKREWIREFHRGE